LLPSRDLQGERFPPAGGETALSACRRWGLVKAKWPSIAVRPSSAAIREWNGFAF